MMVSDILRSNGREVKKIRPERTVQEAIHALVEAGIGSLLVEDENGRLAGIITERDILRLCAQRSQELDSVKVSEVMTRELFTGAPDDKACDLLNRMTQNRIRHLPILRDGELAGLVSIGDLVKAELEQKEFENTHLKEYITQAG